MIRLALLVSLLVGMPASAGERLLDLDEFRGRVVVVDFWASWCEPCRRSFPWLDALQRQYADDGLVVIGVNLDQSEADADAFLEKYPVGFRIVRDPEGALAREFGVSAMPSSFVIGPAGELLAKHLGFKVRQQPEYEAVIREAMAGVTR